MSLAFSLERQVAISAVRRACVATTAVFDRLVKGETLVKGDASPVTAADYSAQAVVNTILAHAFPSDPIVGEEDAGALRVGGGGGGGGAATPLAARVAQLAQEALGAEPGADERAAWGLGAGYRFSVDDLLRAIDRGNHAGGRRGRMWLLDPVDGTKGFLRGAQYAVCLALVVDAQVQLGVVGCPNLPRAAQQQLDGGPRGCLFVAVRGQGAHQIPLSGAGADAGAVPVRLRIPASSPGTLRLLESVEPSHASHAFSARLAARLGGGGAPLRMDSMAKYAALARGDGGLYLRMPVNPAYREKIWDHACGALLVEEAGGVLTDGRGEALDFGLGLTLGENHGIVAAGKDVHPQVIAAIRQLKAEDEAQRGASVAS